MNEEIARLILKKRYELRIRGINPKRWKHVIVYGSFDELRKIKGFTPAEFEKTWNLLDEMKILF